MSKRVRMNVRQCVEPSKLLIITLHPGWSLACSIEQVSAEASQSARKRLASTSPGIPQDHYYLIDSRDLLSGAREGTFLRDRHSFNATVPDLRSSFGKEVRMRDYKHCVICVLELGLIKSDI